MSSDNSNTAVDMNLASSYIPALKAIIKVLFLLTALTTMQKLGMPINQSIITCTACLYVDRNLSKKFILDTNACAFCTLIAVTVNATRVGLDLDTTIANYVVSALWCLCACFFVCEMHRSFQSTLPVFELNVLFTSIFCGMHGFLSMTAESDMFLYIRAMLFTFFTICWVYTERLHQIRDKHHFSFSPCLDRFVLILLVEWYAVLAYSCVVLCLLIWRQSKWLDKQRDTTDIEVQSLEPHRLITMPSELSYTTPFVNEIVFKKTPHDALIKSLPGVIRPTIEKVGEEEEIDVLTAFLMAKENARKGSHRQ